MHQFVQVKMNYRNRNFGTLFVFVDIEEGGEALNLKHEI